MPERTARPASCARASDLDEATRQVASDRRDMNIRQGDAAWPVSLKRAVCPLRVPTALLERTMRVLFSVLFLAQAFIPAAALADCKALFEALDRADLQPRVAQYGIERRDQLLNGQPAFVRVGKVNYYAFGDEFERVETDGTNPAVQSLRHAAEHDAVRCAPAGNDTYLGAAVEKISVEDPTAAAGDQSLLTLWIDQSTGLPVYQQAGGVAPSIVWVYGDVDEPAVRSASTAHVSGASASDAAALEQMFWICDYAGTKGVLVLNEAAACSAVADELRSQKFGGDFERLLAWWELNKFVQHQELDRALTAVIESDQKSGAI